MYPGTDLITTTADHFLAAGEWYTQTLEVVVPSDTPQQPFYVLAVADTDDVVEEFDLEDNNVASTITTTGPSYGCSPALSIG